MIEDWTLADVERMIGQKWSPPPENMLAARTCYFSFVADQIAQATGELCSDQ